MTTVTHDTPHRQRHHAASTAAALVLFWLIAAALVLVSQRAVGPQPAAQCIAAVVALLLTAAVYMRLIARDGGVTHALGAGITWFVFSMAAEIVMSSRAGHGWFSLLGAPAHPLARNVLMFVWIFAPALFAHREVLS
jgi:hypothetical protein